MMTRDYQRSQEDIHHQGMMNDQYWNEFTSDFGDYELGPAIGFGASATVYEAIFTVPSVYPIPTNSTVTSTNEGVSKRNKPNLSISLPGNSESEERVCAVKISTSHPDVELLGREIKMLGLCRHPNVLRILSTFTLPPDHHRICLVTPFIPGGSLAGLLNWRSRLIASPKSHHFPSFKLGHRKRKDNEEGSDEQNKGTLDEEEIKCVTKQVLEGLGYLHHNGFLHRDIKAGNLLMDEDGTILLADFGVGGDLNVPPSPVRTRKTRLAAGELKFDIDATPTIAQNGFGPGKVERDEPRFRGGEDLRKKKSFVGTPNWMAPEVILGQKYDQKADIWSLGITLLELAHGAAPGAKYKPNKALSHIISDPSPTLDRSVGGYSKPMKEFIDLCLNKDPAARPTAKTLLVHPWLKSAKKPAYLVPSLLAGVPPLAQRQELRRVPTKSSLLSRTSSWDFSTPNPSLPASPIRNSLLIPSARSPSISSNLEYFNSIGRTHSRNSSFSGIPPSPRVSLKQWALDKNYDENSLSIRTGGSERGKSRRSLSSAGLRRGKSASVNFDKNSIFKMTQEENTLSPPMELRSSNSQNDVNDMIRNTDKNRLGETQPILGLISPIMEKTASKESKYGDDAFELDKLDKGMTGLGILNVQNEIEQEIQIQSGLSESPEDMLDIQKAVEEKHHNRNQENPVLRHEDGKQVEDAVKEVKKSGENHDIQSSRKKDYVNGNDSTRDDVKKNSINSDNTKTSPNNHSPKIPPPKDSDISEKPIANGAVSVEASVQNMPPSNNKIDKEKDKEKKTWLGRRSSIKRTEGRPIVTPINQKYIEGNESIVGGQAMGKTNSWQGVLGKMTSKMHKR